MGPIFKYNSKLNSYHYSHLFILQYSFFRVSKVIFQPALFQRFLPCIERFEEHGLRSDHRRLHRRDQRTSFPRKRIGKRKFFCRFCPQRIKAFEINVLHFVQETEGCHGRPKRDHWRSEHAHQHQVIKCLSFTTKSAFLFFHNGTDCLKYPQFEACLISVPLTASFRCFRHFNRNLNVLYL